jgi:hypothetical protein
VVPAAPQKVIFMVEGISADSGRLGKSQSYRLTKSHSAR